LEGDLDGDTDGERLGLFDGLTEAEGLTDGLILGDFDGDLLGDTDGEIEADGLKEGLTLGEIEGEIDGETDGEMEGDTLADSEGRSAKSPVSTTNQSEVPFFLYSSLNCAELVSPVALINILRRVLTFLHLVIGVSWSSNQVAPSSSPSSNLQRYPSCSSVAMFYLLNFVLRCGNSLNISMFVILQLLVHRFRHRHTNSTFQFNILILTLMIHIS